jgi:hypothetical protein
MAYKVKKTEHSGSKKGQGAYYGRKRDAKRESTRVRRRADQGLARVDLAGEPFLTVAFRAKSTPKGKTKHADIDRILYGQH